MNFDFFCKRILSIRDLDIRGAGFKMRFHLTIISYQTAKNNLIHLILEKIQNGDFLVLFVLVQNCFRKHIETHIFRSFIIIIVVFTLLNKL